MTVIATSQSMFVIRARVPWGFYCKLLVHRQNGQGRRFRSLCVCGSQLLGSEKTRMFKASLEILSINGKFHAVVTHYRPLGNVREYYENKAQIPNNVVARIMLQLLKALQFLHGFDIVHCRVGLENLSIVRLEPYQIELTGLESSVIGTQQPIMAAGSPPEIWENDYRGSVGGTIWEDLVKKQGYMHDLLRAVRGKPVDIWSAGCLCSELTLRNRPRYLDEGVKIPDENAARYIELRIAGTRKDMESSEAWTQKFKPPLKPTSPALLTFLRKLLDLNPTSRAKVEDCLMDPWLTTGDHDTSAKDLTRKRSVEERFAIQKRSRLSDYT